MNPKKLEHPRVDKQNNDFIEPCQINGVSPEF